MSLRKRATLILAILLISSALPAAEVQLTALTVPEGQPFEIAFNRTSRAPSKAEFRASITFEKRRGSILLSFQKMEPAVLFSGDISSYVLWAVGVDGTVDNLGEVPIDRKNCSGSQQYYASKRIFALMVTAEPVTAAGRPSVLVLFTSSELRMSNVLNTPFTFNNFLEGAKPALESIAGFQYSDDTPVPFIQAQRVLEKAEKMNAAAVNPTAMRNAKTAFDNAKKAVQARSAKSEITAFSRQALQLASQAVMDTIRANEARAAAEAEAKRQAERAALEQRASAAETEAQRISRELKEVETQRAALAQESKEMAQQRDAFAADRDKVAAERDRVAADRDKVAAERDAVAAERETIKKDRDQLAGMLKGALSKVAETNETARGVIVSLPGILFDVNKATLKFPSQLTVAKLAGILTVFQNMDLSIEGYTDSTGTDELNMKLSADRARAVYDFLRDQGIPESRMRYQGFGPANPVAPNDTEFNRAKNRRVEVVLTQATKTP
jgi:outer membrane protein OmpA-like peptidoglycan-associated protein